MSKMKSSSALALLILLNLSVTVVGRFSRSLFFSTRVQNLVPLLIQEPTEVASVTLLLY